MNSSNQEKLSQTKKRREREKEQRRLVIVDAAEKLFLSQGFENTTMEQIALEAEFSKGTLYNYYNSKDELYMGIGSKAYELILKYTTEFTEKEDAGMKQLMAVGYAYYEFTKKYPAYATIFHDIAVKVPNIAKKPKNKLSENENEYINLSNNYRDILIKVLSDAVEIKAVRDDKNLYLIGYVLSTLTSGLINDLMQSENFIKRLGLKSDEIVDFMFEILAEGLKPRE